MSTITLNVVAGQRRVLVGTIAAVVGMLTSAGRISRITSKKLYFEDGSSRRNVGDVSVRHTEARRFGYPHSKDSQRISVRYIRRGANTIAA